MKKGRQKTKRGKARAKRPAGRHAKTAAPAEGSLNGEQLKRYHELQELVSELQSSQEEIQVQNQRLRESQILLEEAATRYADLYDFAPVGYVTLNQTGVIVEMNLTAAALLGKARERLVGKPFVVHVQAGDRREFLQHLFRCRQENAPVVSELALRSSDGTVVSVELSSAPAVNRAGGAMWYQTAIIDLRDYKRAEAEHAQRVVAKRNEELLGAVLRGLPVGVRLIDAGGKVTMFNQAAQRIWRDFAGKPFTQWGDLVIRAEDATTRGPAEGQPLLYPAWPTYRVRKSRQPILDQVIHVTFPDGTQKIVQESAVPVVGEDGELLAVVGVSEDVTQRRRDEMELVRAKENAETASRLKDEFLATVSHELRTPLSAILLWTHLLKSGQSGEQERAEALDIIQQSADAQKTLVEDLLDVSRIISGKLRINPGRYSMRPAVRAAMDSIRPTADLRGVELIADLPEPGGDDDIALRIDPVRIQQVVWNLLSNAIKFTPRGGRVNISLGREGGVVRLVVRDSGRGIPPAFLPYVFDRFRQAESPLNRDYGGLGLGLAICRHLVEAHDGTIRAQSPGPGEGATFTVELPIHTPPPPSTALMKRT